MQKKVIVFSILSTFLAFGSLALPAFAEDIAITDNGSSSENTAQASSNTTTSIQQSNSANISNTVNTTSDTGNNTASNNTGSATITTGDVQTATSISNQGNISDVSQACCPQGSSSTTISGNGANSTNTASSNSTSTNSLSVNQHATITNSITGTANTGNNIASGNTGNVSIHTGDISVYQSIQNAPVNLSFIQLGSSFDPSHVTIEGNGANSNNHVYVNQDKNNLVYVNNNARFVNESTLYLNTGGNEALVNVGNVDIATGDIIALTEIKNVANVSEVKITCCNKPGENPPTQTPPTTPPTTTTTVTTSGGGPSGSSQPSSGSVLSATTGNILPATGGNWGVIFLLGNIIMLFLGTTLRLRSGRSPGMVFSI